MKQLLNEPWSILAALAFLAVLALVITGVAENDAFWGLFGVILGSLLTILARRRSEQEERRFRLSIAALDERLKAHQQAYTHWYDIVHSLHNNQLPSKINAAQNWWKNNSLYLDSEVRREFSELIMKADSHSDLRDRWLSTSGDEKKTRSQELKENWRAMIHTGDAIARAVELPGITEADVRQLEAKQAGDTGGSSIG